MSNGNTPRLGQMSLEAWIAVICVPMTVVFPVLHSLAQEYGFLRGKPLHFVGAGLFISLLLSFLLVVAYFRFELLRRGAAVIR